MLAETAGIPLSFLERYPFPAAVLHPVLPLSSGPPDGLLPPEVPTIDSNPASIVGGIASLTLSEHVANNLHVAWANKPWEVVTGSRPLDESVSLPALVAFARWVSSGADDGHTLTIDSPTSPATPTTLLLAHTRVGDAVIVTSIIAPSSPAADPFDKRTPLHQPTALLSPPEEAFETIPPSVVVAGGTDGDDGMNKHNEPEPQMERPLVAVSSRASPPPSPRSDVDVASPPRRMSQNKGVAALTDEAGNPSIRPRETTAASSTPTVCKSTPSSCGPSPMTSPNESIPCETRGTSPSSESYITRPGSPKRDNEGPLRVQQHLPQDNFTQYDYNVKMQAAAGEYTDLLHSINWAETELGSYDSWSPAIKTMLSVLFTSATQDSVWVGNVDNIRIFYNRSYEPLLNHPTDFGGRAAEVWKSLWDKLEPIAQRCYAGDSVYHHNDFLLYHKNDRGNFEERYHTWSYVPIRDEERDEIVGLYSMSYDTTYQVVSERRAETTSELIDRLSVLHSRKHLFDTLANVLEKNPVDIPFGLFYSVHGEYPDAQLTLESSIGVPHDHACAPTRMTAKVRREKATLCGTSVALARHRASTVDPLDESLSQMSTINASTPYTNTSTFAISYDRDAWPIAQALETRQCVMVDNCSSIIQGLPLRQWSELPDSALVVPIGHDVARDFPLGVLILGLNIHSSLEGSYFTWIQTLCSHLSTALNNVSAKEFEAEQRLERERLERAKTAWFRGAAHEFRTPLTLIAGPLEDVLRTDLSDKQRSALGIAQRNVERLQRLLTSLLEFTKIEAGRITVHFVATDLGEFVTNLATLFQPAIERLHITFVQEIEPRAENVVFDPVLLETVVANLLSNALKYTETGSVVVRLTYDNEHAHISVIDTGRGIAENEVEYVTELYHRTSDAVASGVVGTGIGLALAKEITRLHNGELTIQSSTGTNHGTIITAHIPLNLIETEEMTELPVPFGAYGRQAAIEVVNSARPGYWAVGSSSNSDSSSNSPCPTRSDSFTSTTSSLRAPLAEALLFEPDDLLLVVDDNHELRSFTKNLFKQFCNVIEAGAVDEALRLVHRRRPHLILSDLLMPHASGMDLLAAIRKDPDPDIRIVPVVLLSAVTEDDVRVDAFVAGAEDYITKPFKTADLVARVHLHMQMGKRRAKLERLFEMREQEIGVLSDYCPSGIVRFDANGKLAYSNSAFRDPAGVDAATVENTTMWELWRTRCDAETWVRLQHDLLGIVSGDTAATTIEWTWLTGRTMSGVFLRLDKVRPGMSGIIACLTDISYQKERLLEAERRRSEAEHSREQQELLVDFTSHEIRTPVSAILQCSSLVKDNLAALRNELLAADVYKPTPALLLTLEEDITALESIYQCGLYQERIAADVLSLSRIQLNSLHLDPQPMSIRSHARQILSAFAAEARMSRVGISLVFGPSLDRLGIAAVKADSVRLRQVLTNLIANAIRFTSTAPRRDIIVRFDVGHSPPLAGSATRPSSPPRSDGSPDTPGESPPPLAPEDTDVYLFVSVRDTGPGIPEDERATLFQRFREGAIEPTSYGGSGLGLFICKKITELLGGDIEVESTLGQGSDFRFFISTSTAAPDFDDTQDGVATRPVLALFNPTATGSDTPASNLAGSGAVSAEGDSLSPLSRDGERTLRSPSSSVSSFVSGLSDPRSASITTAATTPEPAAPLRVLVVEDNLITQRVLQRQLTKAGVVCVVANNGLEGLAAISSASAASEALPFDVVLMDLEMPIMDGVTAVRRLRASEGEPVPRGSLPRARQLVIALTGNARQGQIDSARAAGMDDVVLKPYRFPALLSTIREAVERMREENSACRSLSDTDLVAPAPARAASESSVILGRSGTVRRRPSPRSNASS